MNKISYMCFVVALVCLLLLTGSFTILHYHFIYATKEWFRESIQDGDYVIVANEVGDTFLGGQTRVRIYVYDHVNGGCMASFETTIANEGERLTADNYRIEHDEESIKITLIDWEDRGRVAYRLFFEDFQD